jgi:hypothetical protein
MSGVMKLYRDVTRYDRSALSFPIGLRAAAFVTAPLLLGIVVGQKELVYATLGALFVANTEGPKTISAPMHVLLLASFTEAVAFGLGTLAGTTGLVAIPLMGLGVFLPLLMAVYPEYSLAAMFTAIFFAVGVGLPGGSVAVTGDRFVLSLAGGLWGASGIALHRFVSSRWGHPTKAEPPRETPQSKTSVSLIQSEAFKHAAAVGITASLGLSVALALGLPRDFWVVVTIVLALRPGVGPTVDFTTMIVVGTVVGAILAAFVTLEVTEEYVLWAILLLVAIGLFATRGMNFTLTQVFVTPFIIILLNILYPGQWQLAEVRIGDVAIGGAIALVAAYLVQLRHEEREAMDVRSAELEPGVLEPHGVSNAVWFCHKIDGAEPKSTVQRTSGLPPEAVTPVQPNRREGQN